ncbi:MAG TPA: hypothetical protein DCQ94_13820, partial [Nitrospira sp.]|nr:hypothetical protein [Nitrospira sp.]
MIILVTNTPIVNSSQSIKLLQDNIAQVIKGKSRVIELAVVCLLARGHLLIEDVPKVVLPTPGTSSIRR